MIFLKNPKKKGKKKMVRKKRAVPKGFSSWKTYMAHIRKAKKSGGKRKKMAKRKISKKRKSKTVTTGTHIVRRYRTNPPRVMRFFGGNIVNKVMDGAIDATEIVVGKAIARTIPAFFGIPTGGPMGLVIQLGGGIVAGFVGSLVSPNAAKMMLASGLAAPIESIVKQMNIPLLSASLGEDLVEISAYPQEGYSAYPQLGEGAYPGSDMFEGMQQEAFTQ